MTTPLHARLTAVHPTWAIPQAQIDLEGSGFDTRETGLPEVRIGDAPARVVFAGSTRLGVVVPTGLPRGRTPIHVSTVPGETPLVDLGAPLATGLHQVDSPVFDRAGNLYVTYSGARGQRVPVSVFRVRPDGTREPFVTGLVNATSMAFDPLGVLHVSSRFDGTVSRVNEDGSHETIYTELGVACGLAFDPDGTLYVGDRNGTIFKVTTSGQTVPFVSLPSSIAAYHLAFGPDGCLYVTAPTLDTSDVVYCVRPDGSVGVFQSGFGRPQGLAVDSHGALYVVDALAGASGLYRLGRTGTRELVLSGPGLVGVVFDQAGGLVVTSNDTAYRLDVPVRPFTRW